MEELREEEEFENGRQDEGDEEVRWMGGGDGYRFWLELWDLIE